MSPGPSGEHRFPVGGGARRSGCRGQSIQWPEPARAGCPSLLASAHVPLLGASLAPAPGCFSSIALSLAISRSARIRPWRSSAWVGKSFPVIGSKNRNSRKPSPAPSPAVPTPAPHSLCAPPRAVAALPSGLPAEPRRPAGARPSRPSAGSPARSESTPVPRTPHRSPASLSHPSLVSSSRPAPTPITATAPATLRIAGPLARYSPTPRMYA